MSNEVVYAINAALLWFGSIEAVVMVLSFRRTMLQNPSQRLFFVKICITAFCMICYAIYSMRSSIHNGQPLRNGDILDVVLLTIAYAGIYAVYFVYIQYLKAQIDELDPERKVPQFVTSVALIICVIGMTIWALSAFYPGLRADVREFLHMEFPCEFGHLGGLLLVALTMAILFKHYKILGLRNMVILSSMPVLMLIATFVEPILNGVELHYTAIIIEFIIVYTQHHLDMESRMVMNKANHMRTQLELATGRMRPHYLYNVLTTIYYLCESDPQTAQSAIGTFAEYLRGSLEAMETNDPVSFSWELSEIRHYLALEKLRFGDKLKIEYDIQYEDLTLPPLSVQPLVENAVKHGIGSKEEGGTIRIESRRLSDGGAQINVIDDGNGFDVAKLRQQDRMHEGIANVRERLRYGIGGELTITSAKGEGTRAEVTIRPKDE